MSFSGRKRRIGDYLMPARILVVEDNVVNQKLMQCILQAGGYTVDIAFNGQEAVDKVARPDMPYAAVLMDVQMPMLDGIEATRRIRAWEERNGARRVPIIAVTAHVMRWNREQCLAAGMDDFLAKPITKKSALYMLEKWLSESGNAPGSSE